MWPLISCGRRNSFRASRVIFTCFSTFQQPFQATARNFFTFESHLHVCFSTFQQPFQATSRIFFSHLQCTICPQAPPKGSPVPPKCPLVPRFYPKRLSNILRILWFRGECDPFWFRGECDPLLGANVTPVPGRSGILLAWRLGGEHPSSTWSSRSSSTIIAYKGEYMARKNALGEWRASPLTSLRSGHLALHLSEKSVSLSTLVKSPERPDHGRGDRRDGEGDDHEDRHRDGGGNGGGDHCRPKGTRSEATVRSDQRTLSACECCGASNCRWDHRKKHALSHRPWRLRWHPMRCRRDITIEPNLCGRHATSDAWWLWAWVTNWKTFWTWSFWVAQCFFCQISWDDGKW